MYMTVEDIAHLLHIYYLNTLLIDICYSPVSCFILLTVMAVEEEAEAVDAVEEEEVVMEAVEVDVVEDVEAEGK